MGTHTGLIVMSVKETLAITQRNSLIYTYIGSDLIWWALTGESDRKRPAAVLHAVGLSDCFAADCCRPRLHRELLVSGHFGHSNRAHSNQHGICHWPRDGESAAGNAVIRLGQMPAKLLGEPAPH